MNLIEAKVILNHYIDENIPVFWWGMPGVGKSKGIYQTLYGRGFHKESIVEERLSQIESIDLRGVPYVHDGLVKWAKPDFLRKLEIGHEKYGKSALFLDEGNSGLPSTMAASYQLVLDRRIGPHSLPPDCLVLGAGNRQIDRAVVNRMPSALANRFAHMDIDPDMKAWQEWANENGISPMVRAFLQFRENLLHKMDGSDLRAFPSPRSWEEVSKICDKGDTVRQRLVTGLVGEGAGAEFEGFIQMWKTLPPMAEIIRNPTGASIPHEPATRYAVSTGLSRLADRNNLTNILIYAARLPKEFEISIATEAVKRDKTLTQTTAYVNWAKRNQDVTL